MQRLQWSTLCRYATFRWAYLLAANVAGLARQVSTLPHAGASLTGSRRTDHFMVTRQRRRSCHGPCCVAALAGSSPCAESVQAQGKPSQTVAREEGAEPQSSIHPGRWHHSALTPASALACSNAMAAPLSRSRKVSQKAFANTGQRCRHESVLSSSCSLHPFPCVWYICLMCTRTCSRLPRRAHSVALADVAKAWQSCCRFHMMPTA